MSRPSMLILLGILIILMPYSGFPVSIRSFFSVIFGVCVFAIGLSIRTHEARAAQPSQETPPSAPPPSNISPI